jgi:tellurite methyltransferase
MKTAFAGFHQDGAGDWVAELACGHTQHVRHRPPWELREWVTSAEGRAAKLGQTIDCPLCDTGELSPGARGNTGQNP